MDRFYCVREAKWTGSIVKEAKWTSIVGEIYMLYIYMLNELFVVEQ